MLNSTDFSAKDNVFSGIFDVTNVVGHLVYATDFASCVHLVATIGFDESKRLSCCKSALRHKVLCLDFFGVNHSFYVGDFNCAVEGFIKILLQFHVGFLRFQNQVRRAVKCDFYNDFFVFNGDRNVFIAKKFEEHLLIFVEIFVDFVSDNSLISISADIRDVNVDAGENFFNNLLHLCFLFVIIKF